MKKMILTVLVSLVAICSMGQNRLYDYKVTDIDGKEFDMSTLKGKKVLIVNVASKCGLTPQYEKLEALYKKYKDTGFEIVGFPSNDFKGQEPGSNEDIKSFCSLSYGVTFPMMSKVEVLKNKAPIYKWLTEKAENGKFDAEVKWNFQKFMIGRDGQVVDFVAPMEDPFSPKIVKWLEEK